MAFKQNPNKKPRWEELSKTALIKTVKTLNTRQTKLLNQIVKLETQLLALQSRPAGVSALDTESDVRSHLYAVEFGYRAGEKGEWNLEMTLHKWHHPIVTPIDVAKIDRRQSVVPTGTQLDDMLEHAAPAFPWEQKE